MPKIVDHEARRAEIAQAVRRVLLRDGVAGTTVRAVVAESGMSSGAIRHYFASHDELLRFAAKGIAERVSARANAAFSRVHSSPRARAADILAQLLPLDRERQMELNVFTELVARDPDDAAGSESWQGIRVCTRAAVLALADRSQQVRSDRPLRPARLERLAERLHFVLDGIAASQYFYGFEPDAKAQLAALRRAVDDVSHELSSFSVEPG